LPQLAAHTAQSHLAPHPRHAPPRLPLPRLRPYHSR
jgi:hypothetical protein